VELARRQHGVVTAAQLREVGIHRRGIAHRVRHGRLTPLHRGVYLVGPNETPFTRLMAATLACGPTAVLSDQAAAFLHGFGREPTAIDVTVRSGQPRTRAGLRVHRAKLTDAELTTHEGIPVTTPARTITDLAKTTAERELGRAVEEALIQRRIDTDALTRAVDEAAGQRGARALRATAQTRDPQITRSEAERRLKRLVQQAGLERPRTNRRIGGYEVDAMWPRQRLVVEVDGYAFHGGRAAFERDRRRDANLTAGGWRVIRVTWRQLVDEPHLVVARISAALALAAAA
jgi:very-short-patch-repair endonuclease